MHLYSTHLLPPMEVYQRSVDIILEDYMAGRLAAAVLRPTPCRTLLSGLERIKVK